MNAPESTADRINRDIDMARREIERADGKAGDIVKIAIAGLGVLLAVGASLHLPIVPLVLGLGAVAAGLAAVVLVGLVLWPRLGRTVLGYLSHHDRTDDEIVEALSAPPTDEHLAGQLRYLVRTVVAKFRLIRAAELALASGLLLVVAGALAR